MFLGYVINYKRDHGDWEEIHLDSKTDTHLLRGLWCGTKYQLYMTAYNKIGTGLPCDIVTAYTKGSGKRFSLAIFFYENVKNCLQIDMLVTWAYPRAGAVQISF